jgi:hypothetical protein
MATGALIYSDESLIIANSLGDATVYIEYEPAEAIVYDKSGEVSSSVALIAQPSWEDDDFQPDWNLTSAEITLPLTVLKGGNSFTLDIAAFAPNFISAPDETQQEFPLVDVKIIVQQKGVVGTFATEIKGLKLYCIGDYEEIYANLVPVTITAVNGRITGVR